MPGCGSGAPRWGPMSGGEQRQPAAGRRGDPGHDRPVTRPRRWYELGRSPNAVVRQGYRMIVLVVGAAVVAAGLAMFVLPGPGILVLIAGLAILGTEFLWARRLLQRARRYAATARQKAMSRGGVGGLKKKVTGRS